jgi:tetratricopeptide (TPR) repeat protein
MTQQEKEFVKANLNFNIATEIPQIAINHYERGIQEDYGDAVKCLAFEQAILAYPNYIEAILEYVKCARFTDFDDPQFFTYLICKIIEYNPFNEDANYLLHELIIFETSNHLYDHIIASNDELFELIIKCLDNRDIINPNKVGSSEVLKGQRSDISYNDSSLLRGIIMLYREFDDYDHEKAIEEFSKYTDEKVIDRIGIRFFITDAYFDAENYEEAEKEITKSIENKSPIWLNNKVNSYYFRAIIRRHLDNYTESIQDINRSIQLCNKYLANDESVSNQVISLLLLDKGITEYYLNNIDVALADITSARELNNDLIESYLSENYLVNDRRVNSEISVLKTMFPDWNDLDRYLEE